MKFLIFIFVIVASLGARANECDFYREKSTELRCQPSGYLVGFGDKYCRHFIDHADDFSVAGQATLQKIRSCLIASLKSPAVALTCENVKDLALQSHVDCYVSNGFCSLDIFDRLGVYWALRDHLQDPSFIAAGEEVRRQCHFIFFSVDKNSQ